MKKLVAAAVLVAGISCFATAGAETDPTVYVIKKGDTLWGLSGRFLKDKRHWPNLWANNGTGIGNPHLIFPGQKVRVYADRIEIEPAPPAPEAPAQLQGEEPAVAVAEEPAPEQRFTIRKGSGRLLEQDAKPYGVVIATYQNRQMVGADDVVFTDIGRDRGAKTGDRYEVLKNGEPVVHPRTGFIVGYRSIPLGTLELVDIDKAASKAVITESFMEIGRGASLMPAREKVTEVSLKAASRDASGFIAGTQTGDQIVAAGDIVFLDLGRRDGVENGNLLYISRDLEIERQYLTKFEKLPREVLGALVVVDAGEKVSTALIVKSIDAMYVGDRVEMKGGK